MQARVVLTRIQGVRREPTEIRADAGVQGELSISYMLETHCRRPLRLAHLHTPRGVSGTMVDVLKPLADPTLVRCRGNEMMLVGFETGHVDGRQAEHAQGWLIRLG